MFRAMFSPIIRRTVVPTHPRYQPAATLVKITRSCVEVACWPLVPKLAGSHPAEAVGFLGRKNPHHFGGEVKPSVPRRSITACKRSLNVTWKLAFRQNSGHFSPTVPTSAAGCSRVVTRLVAKVGTSNPDRTSFKRLQCVVENEPKHSQVLLMMGGNFARNM
jgi:hypothetical protein